MICTKRASKESCQDCLYENFLFIQWPCTKCYSASSWEPVPEGVEKPKGMLLPER